MNAAAVVEYVQLLNDPPLQVLPARPAGAPSAPLFHPRMLGHAARRVLYPWLPAGDAPLCRTPPTSARFDRRLQIVPRSPT